MRKFLVALLALLMVAGCSTPAEEETVEVTEENAEEVAEELVEEIAEDTGAEVLVTEGLSILTPTGAPAVAMIPAMLEESYTVATVDGTEVLQAAFVNPEPEYDVIVAPSNLGGKLASAGKTTYKMLAVVTWGNLYIVGSDENALSGEGELALFGETAVPGLVFEKVLGETTTMNKTYYNAVTDAQAALLSDKADAALLAEPAATATIGKAKEAGKELKIIANLQEVWGGGYPQAALFVNAEDYAANPEKYDTLVDLMNAYIAGYNAEDTSALEADIESIGVETLGVPAAAIVGKTYKRLGINEVTYAKDVKDQLAEFLGLFGVEGVDNIVAE